MKNISRLRTWLIEEAKKVISDKDTSHDLNHALLVLNNAEYITQIEGGNLEIIIPAALFHDAVIYPKDSPMSSYSAEESARVARDILESYEGYDKNEIPKVEEAILEHSYSKGIRPKSLESKIVQDADRLGATGAVAIMRTFCSTGQMGRRLYSLSDPFCENREPDSSYYALDLFYKRLLKVRDLMNTPTGKRLAEKRTQFLYLFLDQLKEEL